MNQSIWDLKSGERITLDSGAVAEVLAPTEDGEWILVKYRCQGRREVGPLGRWNRVPLS